MHYIIDKKGLYFKGEVKFYVSGDKYNLCHNPPLYLNVIKEEKIEAFPTDQSGGIRGGDSHNYSLSMDSNANVVWYSPASTLCYPSMYSLDDCCNLSFNINLINSKLIFINKPLIPCKDSNIKQKIKIEVDSNSSLVYWDAISSGRTAHNEKWDFRCFENKLELHCDNILVYKENWTLTKNMIPTNLSGFGENNLYATGIFFGTTALEKLERLKQICNKNKCSYSIGKILDNFAILKLVDNSGIFINKIGQSYL